MKKNTGSPKAAAPKKAAAKKGKPVKAKKAPISDEEFLKKLDEVSKEISRIWR